jgi:hypothetical protein
LFQIPRENRKRMTMSLTPEETKRLQAKYAEKETFARKAAAGGNGPALPAVRQSTVLASADNRDDVDRVLDDMAPSFLAGPMAGFNGKTEKFVITVAVARRLGRA